MGVERGADMVLRPRFNVWEGKATRPALLTMSGSRTSVEMQDTAPRDVRSIHVRCHDGRLVVSRVFSYRAGRENQIHKLLAASQLFYMKRQ